MVEMLYQISKFLRLSVPVVQADSEIEISKRTHFVWIFLNHSWGIIVLFTPRGYSAFSRSKFVWTAHEVGTTTKSRSWQRRCVVVICAANPATDVSRLHYKTLQANDSSDEKRIKVYRVKTEQLQQKPFHFCPFALYSKNLFNSTLNYSTFVSLIKKKNIYIYYNQKENDEGVNSSLRGSESSAESR